MERIVILGLSEEFYEMYFRIVILRVKRGKYYFISFRYILVKGDFIGINFKKI